MRFFKRNLLMDDMACEPISEQCLAKHMVGGLGQHAGVQRGE